MKNLIFISLALLIVSCSPPETESDICIDNMIEILSMENYSGVVENDCKYTYLHWYTHEKGNYFTVSNPCQDHAQHLYNCENVNLYIDNPSEYEETTNEMTAHGIIARTAE